MHSEFTNCALYRRMKGWWVVMMNHALTHTHTHTRGGAIMQNCVADPDGLKTKTSRGDKRQSWPDVAYWPSTQLVEKKQMLRVSRGLSCVNSGERVWGSDSPVREELSTFTGRKGGERGMEKVLPGEAEGQKQGRREVVRLSGCKWRKQLLSAGKCRDETLVMSKPSSGLCDFSHVPLQVKKFIPPITAVF